MYARLGEIISLDCSIAVTLAAHQAIGLKVRGLGFRSGEGAAGSASRRKARCPAASLSCSLAVPCSVPFGGPVLPFETSSCPIASDPSFQAQARCHCLHGACLHHRLEVTPPLDWLPRGLSVSPLLLAPVILLRCLESFRAGPGAHSSFLGWFLFSVETEGAECTASLVPGRGAAQAPAVAPATRLWPPCWEVEELPERLRPFLELCQTTLDCVLGGLPGSPAPQTLQQLPIFYCGCQLLREGSVFQRGCVLQARFTHFSLATAESSPCVLPGHHLGRQRGAEGQVPAQAGFRGARGRLLPDGASQVSPARHSQLQGPGAFLFTEAGWLASSLPEDFPGVESTAFLTHSLHALLSLPYFSFLVTFTNDITWLTAPVISLCFATLLIYSNAFRLHSDFQSIKGGWYCAHFTGCELRFSEMG